VDFLANGRVNAIAADPTDGNVIYVGTAGGGVWKTRDGGTTWLPLTDQQPTLGIGTPRALAIDPTNPNVIYAGTSSFALLAQSRPRPMERAQSKGILKSTDGGASWMLLGSGVPGGNVGNAAAVFTGRNINTIIIDPADTDVLYLAAGRGGDTLAGGLYRSEDGGRNWTAGAGGAAVMAESLTLDLSSPAGSRVLYAGAAGVGVLRSTDGGQTWSAVLTPATPAVAAAAPGGFQKVMVAVPPTATPANAAGGVVYVSLMVNNVDALIFANASGGASASWVMKSAQVVGPAIFPSLTGGGFSDLLVDPTSPGNGSTDRLYWGGFSQYLSTDSGSTFTEIGQIHGTHGDHQTWAFAPQPSSPSVVYAGDDGGVWRSLDAGATWTGTSLPGSPPTINAGGLQVATLYALAVKQDATASVSIGGAQDSGMLRTTGGLQWTGTSNDGIDVVFDKVSTNIAYSVQNGPGVDVILKSTDSGATWATDITSNIPAAERGLFRNRLAVDPNNAGYLYVGGSEGSVFQTTNGGGMYRSLGTPAPGRYVSALDVAPSDSNRLVIAANDFPQPPAAVGRRVLVTTHSFDASVTFQDITRNLPARFVTQVIFDPNDANVIYAVVAGFGAQTPLDQGHVYRTTIDGATWSDISPPVDIPANAIAADAASGLTVLYVGTELGIVRSLNGGLAWEVVDDIHLPNAAISAIEVNEQAGVLRVSTWGRGVFELAAPSGPVIAVDAEKGLAFGETCLVTGATLSVDLFNVGTQALVINSVQRLSGSSDFTVLPAPSTPLTIAPGGHVVFSVQFIPTSAGPQSAVIRISSNDPAAPLVDLVATGALETVPPVISSLAAAPPVLGPPNHKMVPVTLTIAVTDNCDPAVAQSCQILSITSNEPVLGSGDGQTTPDWEITGALTARLRAERSGAATGRVYTITVRCTDNAGNSATRAVPVRVPHD
jgi:photosystem II stability/assembly factor-like uncharacterized protein